MNKASLKSEGDEDIELDEFEVFKSRAYSKGPTAAAKRESFRNRLTQKRTQSKKSVRGSSGCLLSDFADETHQSKNKRTIIEDSNGFTKENDPLLSNATRDETSKILQRQSSRHSSRIPTSPRLNASRLGRSQSCRPRTRPRHPADHSRPRGSLADVTERHSSLTEQTSSSTGLSDFEIYRVRSFTTTHKGGIINRGDSFKLRSPLCRRPLLNDSEISVFPSLSSLGRRKDSTLGDSTLAIPEEISLSEREIPLLYRVLISGGSGVGKTALTQQLMTSEYLGDVDMQMDENPSNINRICVQVDSEECFIDLLDGQQGHNNISDDVDGHVIVFSVTDKSSFRYADARLQEVRSRVGEVEDVVILVANKQDLVRNRKVKEDAATSLAKKYNCKYIEVSSILNHRIDELLVGIVRQIRLQQRPNTEKSEGDASDQAPNSEEPNDELKRCLPGCFLRLAHYFGSKGHQDRKSCENLLT